MFDFAKADNGTVIEGFLNDNQEAKILFILREPDCPDQQEFWFRMIHDDKRDANGKSYRGNKRNLKYYNTFATLAAYIMDSPHNANAISYCAYMNLFAASGKNYASDMYQNTYNAITGVKCDSEVAQKRAEQFKVLLNDFLETGTKHIVTVNGIFNLLLGDSFKSENIDYEYNADNLLTLSYQRKGIHYKTFRKCKCKINGHEVTLHEFWHPAYTTFTLKSLKEALPDYYIDTQPHD